MINIVGDSSAGKTFLALTILAECAYDPSLSGHRLIYDDAESANSFNMRKLFGQKAEERIDTSIQSATVQDWKKHMIQLVQEGQPFVYVLDSYDSLTSDEAIDRALKAAKTGEEGGSYKTEKARIGGEVAALTVTDMAETGSILIVVSQTRDNIGVLFGEKKTRSGGHWLQFYSTHVLWLAVVTKETVTLKRGGKETKREIGVQTRVRVKKNKLTGKVRDCNLHIYYDYGVDDVRSNIEFMLEYGFWTETKKRISAPEFDQHGVSRAQLVEYIEENGLQKKLARLVEESWREVEESLQSERRPKYEE